MATTTAVSRDIKNTMNDGTSFEDMKIEFLLMDEEIKEKTLEIEELKRALNETKGTLGERKRSSTRMVDQMEELHENLAELDSRFARSEEMNLQLRDEKETIRKEFEKEINNYKTNLETVENQLHQKETELSKVNKEFEQHKKTTGEKMQSMQFTFKNSIDNVLEPISSYLDKNKGSKLPMKKTKGYRLLKAAETDLKVLTSMSFNNNH